MIKRATPDELAQGVLQGDRTAIGRALTLIESHHFERRLEAQSLLRLLLDSEKPNTRRIGITGPPGVGKSTLIDAWGQSLLERGHKVAVLAVDPSSPKSGGSILGDKTRMPHLSVDARAFVRPSPSRGHLGGVTLTARDSVTVLEAAGYDTILIETVGVGQSETLVQGMVDVFCVLLLPGSGDELQGIKKGIIELADILAVNKADGANLGRATEATRQLAHAVRIITPSNADWTPPVLTISATEGSGLDKLSEAIFDFEERHKESGAWERRRQAQDVACTRELVNQHALERVWHHPAVAAAWPDLAKQVTNRALRPDEAAEKIASLLTQMPSDKG